MGTSRARAQLAADLEPVAARQHQVEQHHVEARAAAPRRAPRRRRGAHHADPVAVQVLGGALGERGVVFDQQRQDGGRLVSSGRLSRPPS